MAKGYLWKVTDLVHLKYEKSELGTILLGKYNKKKVGFMKIT